MCLPPSSFYIRDNGKSRNECKECLKLKTLERKYKDLEKFRKSRKISDEKRKNEIKSYQKEWYLKNKINIIEKVKNRYETIKHNKDFKEKRCVYLKSRRKDPSHKLRDSIAGGIYKSLRERKNGAKWESLVNYTLKDLITHLESLFSQGMSLENYGEWEIDHKIPLRYKVDGKYFWNQEELADSSSETFKKAWSLDNLQPLSARCLVSKK
jgi:hypothetical protein